VQDRPDRANFSLKTGRIDPFPDLFVVGLGRAAHVGEKRSGTLNLRDDDRSLVPPGDTGSPRSGGPARASPTQSRTAAPPVEGRTPQLAAYREKVSRKAALGGIGRPATTIWASAQV
jgi:hypothetical protein